MKKQGQKPCTCGSNSPSASLPPELQPHAKKSDGQNHLPAMWSGVLDERGAGTVL